MQKNINIVHGIYDFLSKKKKKKKRRKKIKKKGERFKWGTFKNN